VLLQTALKQIQQSMDTVSLFRPITKFSAEIDSPDAVSEIVANAFRAAPSGRPGAAFISAPQDIIIGGSRRRCANPLSHRNCSALQMPKRLRQQRLDVVVVIGYNPVEYEPSLWNKERKRHLVHIDAVYADRRQAPAHGDFSIPMCSIEKLRKGENEMAKETEATHRQGASRSLTRSNGMKEIIARLTSCFLLFMSVSSSSFAESTTSEPLKLEAAVEQALNNYPAIRAAQSQKQAAEAGIDLARTSYLPRADLIWQQNRATRNNVTGLLLPQSTIPPITGPVLSRTTQSAWGSAGGLLLSWEPFDFGLRNANVNLARALTDQAQASESVTWLEVSAAAADAFLTLLANEQTVRAAQANVERMAIFAKAVHTLVDNQLRPGVDASRADAELAAARTQSIQAQQSAELARADLAQTIGQAGAPVTIDAGPLLALPPAPLSPPTDLAAHPLALAQTAAIETVRARETVLDRSWFPRFDWQTAVFARGTGARADGTFDNGRGFYPNTFNWATGLTITFSAFDIFGLRARSQAEAHNVQAEQARYDLVIQELKTQDARARTLIESARRIAENTPIQLTAAQETSIRANTRYEFALTDITEVAEAHRLLAQAEIDDAVARLAVWRALLVAAKLQGDLKPFLEQVAKTPIKGTQ
jgi:outer membrane protein